MIDSNNAGVRRSPFLSRVFLDIIVIFWYILNSVRYATITLLSPREGAISQLVVCLRVSFFYFFICCFQYSSCLYTCYFNADFCYKFRATTRPNKSSSTAHYENLLCVPRTPSRNVAFCVHSPEKTRRNHASCWRRVAQEHSKPQIEVATDTTTVLLYSTVKCVRDTINVNIFRSKDHRDIVPRLTISVPSGNSRQ